MSLHREGRRWRVLRAEELYWRRWDEQYVVYDSGSGQTHVLDPAAALLIQLLGERSFEAFELSEKMASLLHVDADAEFQERLQQTLSKLEELSLIETASH